jgi:DnaK suppressor protein
MDATELHFFRSLLLSEKSSILNKTTEFKNEQREEHEKCTDEAELASVDLSLNLSIQQLERNRMTLVQIERALAKISEGTYGQCEDCSAPIGEGRLRARPLATLCIDCMEEAEETRHPLH